MANSAKGWTAERRKQQSEAIARWKPWAKSTGPRSDSGRARVARNAFKGGGWLRMRVLAREVRALLQRQKQLIARL